jgi:hypothetical protein
LRRFILSVFVTLKLCFVAFRAGKYQWAIYIKLIIFARFLCFLYGYFYCVISLRTLNALIFHFMIWFKILVPLTLNIRREEPVSVRLPFIFKCELIIIFLWILILFLFQRYCLNLFFTQLISHFEPNLLASIKIYLVMVICIILSFWALS